MTLSLSLSVHSLLFSVCFSLLLLHPVWFELSFYLDLSFHLCVFLSLSINVSLSLILFFFSLFSSQIHYQWCFSLIGNVSPFLFWFLKLSFVARYVCLSFRVRIFIFLRIDIRLQKQINVPPRSISSCNNQQQQQEKNLNTRRCNKNIEWTKYFGQIGAGCQAHLSLFLSLSLSVSHTQTSISVSVYLY